MKKHRWGPRMLSPLFRYAFLVFALSASALAQSRSSGGKPATGSTGASLPSPFPTTGTNTPAVAPTSIFVTGKVVLDDGSELTEPVIIQTICRGQKHNETYSDAHGGFSFQFGGPNSSGAAAIADASTSNANDRAGTRSTRDFRDCQLQAELAGFSSQIVELSSRVNMLNSVDVGRVPLHRLAHVDGTSISVTSALAPVPARKAFEKGLEQEKKGKWDEAQKSFQKAVEIYPRYATAWYQLGRLQLRNHALNPLPTDDTRPAKHSLEQAVAADPKYVSPYEGLAQLAMEARDWPSVVDLTAKLFSLNPVDFPDAYYYNAVGNYYLKNFDDAERSALQGVRVDGAHQIPRLQYLLAMILVQKQNYQAAAEHMQLYLSLAKEPGDVELGKKGVAEIEKVSASAAQPPVVDLDK
jgi:tetratricopeptide (TPR) repeat protein